MMFVAVVAAMLASAEPAAVTVGVGVTAHDAWLRLPPPTATVMAGYMVLNNDSDVDDALVAVELPPNLAERAELHTHLHEDGKMKMRKVEKIAVPAKSTVTLKSGGLHLMLFQPYRVTTNEASLAVREYARGPLKVGEKQTLTLVFASGVKLPVTFVIAKEAPSSR